MIYYELERGFMKKILLIIAFILMLTGCSIDNENEISTLPTGYSFIYNKKDNQRNFKTIYEYENGKKIISEFDSIEYENYDNNTGKHDLAYFLENKIITIDDLINKMVYLTEANDGGSKLYSSGDQSSIYLVTCHTIDGNENIIIGTNSDIFSKCRN